jgi:hypothetical protein
MITMGIGFLAITIRLKRFVFGPELKSKIKT